MKKMMFLMLTLFMLSAANVNAQVQIGGTKGPDKSAVLDLNGDAGTATGGLALPRVELANDQSTLNGVEPQPGTVVYNTGSAQLAAGTYVWTPVAGGGSTTPFTGISVDNTGANSTIGGTGTPASPLTVNVNANGITATQIANNAVTNLKIAAHTIALDRIATGSGDADKFLMSNGTDVTWRVLQAAATDSSSVVKATVTVPSTNITWKKVLDVDVPITVKNNGATAYKITGLLKHDVCVNNGPRGARVTYWSLDDKIYVLNSDGGDKLNSMHNITCYRPL